MRRGGIVQTPAARRRTLARRQKRCRFAALLESGLDSTITTEGAPQSGDSLRLVEAVRPYATFGRTASISVRPQGQSDAEPETGPPWGDRPRLGRQYAPPPTVEKGV